VAGDLRMGVKSEWFCLRVVLDARDDRCWLIARKYWYHLHVQPV